MDRYTISNREGVNISVIVENPDSPRGLAFVMHGLGGYKEQPHIETFARAFHSKGYTVVRFDTTNSVGESGGTYENATTTNYYADLEDVIQWASTQVWYQEPFALSGHSLGGICTALYAEKHPEKVLALAPISTVVSGQLTIDAHKEHEPEKFAQWEKDGVQITPSTSKVGLIKRLKWEHMIDRAKYDLLPDADTLTMPVLLIVGSEDTLTPPAHQKILFERLRGKKEMHVIEGAPHTFRDPKHLEEIEQIMTAWIDTV